jgi:hypothetical protein
MGTVTTIAGFKGASIYSDPAKRLLAVRWHAPDGQTITIGTAVGSVKLSKPMKLSRKPARRQRSISPYVPKFEGGSPYTTGSSIPNPARGGKGLRAKRAIMEAWKAGRLTIDDLTRQMAEVGKGKGKPKQNAGRGTYHHAKYLGRTITTWRIGSPRPGAAGVSYYGWEAMGQTGTAFSAKEALIHAQNYIGRMQKKHKMRNPTRKARKTRRNGGLTPIQIAAVGKEIVKTGVPVRFMVGGRAVNNLQTLELDAKGINVMYQTHYWCFTRSTAKKIARWIGATPVFDKK